MSVSRNPGQAYYAGIPGEMAGGYAMGTSVVFNSMMGPNAQQLAINSRRVEFQITVFAVFAIEDEGAAAK